MNETRKDQALDESVTDRRDAMKAIARYASYTAPGMIVLLGAGADEAEAHGGRRRRRFRFGKKYRRWAGKSHRKPGKHRGKPQKGS